MSNQKFNNPQLKNQKCKPGLYPVQGILYDCPESEKKVYNALTEALPSNWYAWHSMKLRTLRNEFSESDFVIADPSRGILILEVKGGSISKEDGYWYQNRKVLRTPPMDQAKRCCNILLKRFKEKKINPPTIGIAVCFPDTFIKKGPTQDDLKGFVLGADDLPNLKNILPNLMNKTIWRPRPTQGGWVKELHNMWCESWLPEMQLSLRSRTIKENLIRLDKEQFCALCSIIENDIVLVKGGAGTGKTILSCELAKKEAASGRKVLLLCFTDALGSELSNLFQEPNVTASAIGKFAVKLLRDKGYEAEETYTPEFWNFIPLQAAIDGLPCESERWDTIIVDEGQDMGDNEWGLILECTKQKKKLWVFIDDNQSFWKERKLPDNFLNKCVKYKLDNPYRCPPGIQALANAYVGEDLDIESIRTAIDDRIIKITTSDPAKVHEEVGREINELLKEGFKLSDIAVISLRGMMLAENIMHQKKMGKYLIFNATDTNAYDNIVCDTFLRFKGLERPAVIVTDLRYVVDKYEIRMNMALSRALSVLRIVCAESELNKDPILMKII